MRDAETFPRRVDEFALQFLRRRKRHTVHNAVEHAVPRLQFLEKLCNLVVEGNIAHKSRRARQIVDQVLRFLLQALILIGDGQPPTRPVQLLRNRPRDAALIGQAKNHRRLLRFVHSRVLSFQLSVLNSQFCTTRTAHRGALPISYFEFRLLATRLLRANASGKSPLFFISGETPSQFPSWSSAELPAFRAGSSSGNLFSPAPPAAIPFSIARAAYSL